MLFFVLAVFIVYSLTTFGAVQPTAWLLISIGFIVALAVYLIQAALWRGSWHYSHLLFFLAAVVPIAFARSRFLLSVAIGLLAWLAAREGSRGTLRFLKVLLFIGVAEAFMGLMQYFIAPGWIFGYINSIYRVSGTFINRNHFAGLLEMLIPVAFALAYMAAMRFADLARSYVYLLAGAVMGLALFLSVSRMGIFCFLATLLFLGILLRVRQSRQRLAAGLTLTILGLVFLSALWLGIDVVVQRYSELVGQEAVLRDGRLLVYRDTIRMILAHPMGVGIGNFQDRFREYQTYEPGLLFDHTHNDYLETAAEWGMPIAIVFWTFVVFAFVRAVRLFVSIHSVQQGGILLACIGAMFSILLHSLTDFNLQIPSNAMLFFTFVGISLTMPITDRKNEI
jgi:hypothetical protein